MLSACGVSKNQHSAPANEKEASERFIISGTPEQNKIVIDSSTSYRVISAKHNIYEVSGLNYFEIKNLAPGISATQNNYFQVLEKEDLSVESYLANDNPNPPANLPPILEGCNLEAEVQPEPVLGVNAEVFQPNSPTMQLGNTIAFTGAESKPSVEGTGFEVRWELSAPNSSLLELGITTGNELEVKPDAMGLYRLVMLVKDENQACNVQVAHFMVTANPALNLDTEGQEPPMIEDLSVFSQLARVEAQESWNLATGKDKTIAILDTGLNFLHPAIKFNLAVNANEYKQTADMDDDENGFDDDVLGWDFINNDNNPFDDEGHGSHVAGLAASHIFGLAKDANILPVKVMNAAGGSDLATIIAGFYYAADNGADVINASMQRLQGDIPALRDAIEYAISKNVVVIISAGNDTLDLSLPENQIYPGEIEVDGVINVAAVGVTDSLASYSNFGKLETDVAAPGGDGNVPLFSLAPVNPRDVQFLGSGGTSMAAPIVAGVAAQMLEINSELAPSQVREILMNSGSDVPVLSNVVGSGKLLSAKEAVEAAEAMVVSQPVL